MLYTIGSRVKLRQTGDRGTVSAILGADLVEVRLDDGLGHIPVPTDSLTYADEQPPDGKKSDGARYVPGRPQPPPDEPKPVEIGYTILKPWGIQLAFEPVTNAAGEPQRYRIFLINDTVWPVIFQFQLELTGAGQWQRVGLLPAQSLREIGELRHHELSDRPGVSLEVRKQLDGGTGPRLTHQMRLKPKQFFERLKTAPLLNRRAYHYVIFGDLEPKRESPKTGKKDLLRLTRAELDRRPRASDQLRPYDRTPNPADLAAFPRYLDLHLEALVEQPGQIAPRRRLSTQLEHARAYLRRAADLGVERVYLIHGVGAGKLRDALHAELARTPRVASFKNDYFPEYGMGATEVRF